MFTLLAQRRAIFRHLDPKKCSDTVSFLAFSLGNVLLTTAACNFSTPGLQKVLRSWRVSCIFTSKCSFRHSGVRFLISALTTWLRTHRFNESAFRDVCNIWRRWIFFLLTFAVLHLLSADLTIYSAFQLSILSEVRFLIFLRLFKLPSMNNYVYIYIHIYWTFCIPEICAIVLQLSIPCIIYIIY